MNRIESIERSVRDAVYYSSIGNKPYSDFFIDQAFLLCNNDWGLIHTVKALVITNVVNTVLNKGKSK